jgi:hypothetical protein
MDFANVLDLWDGNFVPGLFSDQHMCMFHTFFPPSPACNLSSAILSIHFIAYPLASGSLSLLLITLPLPAVQL